MKSLGQRARLIVLISYIALLFCASRIALGSWLPPTSEKGLWFYSGLATLLLGNLLVSPFYTKPADAISYAVAAIVGLLAITIPAQGHHTGFDRFLWLVTTFYIVLVLMAGILSIALKDSLRPVSQKISTSLFLFCDALGTPRSIFSIVFLFALIAFHRDSPREYIVIGVAWAFLVGLRPLEAFAELLRRWWEVWKTPASTEPVGEVVAHESPGVVLVRHEQSSGVSFGDTLVVGAEDGKLGLALALDYVGFAEGLWLRALHLPISAESRKRLEVIAPAQSPSGSLALRVEFSGLGIPEPTGPAWTRRGQLVGLVAPDTDISRLRIEIVRTDLDLQEGRLVEVQIGDSGVLYQMVNGITREEIIQQKNTHGYVRGEARKIGRWDAAQGRFAVVNWLPQPNAPIFLVDETPATPNRDYIGHFPGTNYPVSLNIDSLVTHNAAILGILGAGKSFLALELVERMIASGIKVICLDLTNQYAQELSPYYDADTERLAIEKLQKLGGAGKNNVQQNVEEGGSIGDFERAMRDDLRSFVDPKNDRRLKIFNPAAFEVWRQDSKPFSGRASMASLTPTEIARIVTEALLEVLQPTMADNARCCIVFEEAHSLIPEWTAVASEGDKTATNGTAKAILQGRKFGLGCLVVTQRTANVTKSILNQCNTVFALRVFDATGIEFLRNYVGEDYAGVLSTLEDRHAVLFGKASSCKDPVLLRLNDRADFIGIFREGLTAGITLGGKG